MTEWWEWMDRVAARVPSQGLRRLPVFLRLQEVDGFEDVFGLPAGGGAEVTPYDALVANEERLAMGHPENGWDAESAGYGAILIREERKGEMVFFLEVALLSHAIGADAHNDDATRLELAKSIAQAASLRGAARGVGLGIKIDERDSLLVKIGQMDLVALLVGGSRIRRQIADLYRHTRVRYSEPREKTHVIKLVSRGLSTSSPCGNLVRYFFRIGGP